MYQRCKIYPSVIYLNYTVWGAISLAYYVWCTLCTKELNAKVLVPEFVIERKLVLRVFVDG